METIRQKPILLSEIDQFLGSPDLLSEPKSVFLIRIFNNLRVLYPEFVEVYWEQLKTIEGSLPQEYKGDYLKLNRSLNPLNLNDSSNFNSSIRKVVEEAKLKIGKNPSESNALLLNCISKINRRWWSSGRDRLWKEIIPVLFEVNRHEALKKIRKISPQLRQVYIKQWNMKSPFSEDEWSLLKDLIGSELYPIIKLCLDEEDTEMHLLGKVIKVIGNQLIESMFYLASDETPDTRKSELKEIREKSLARFKSLLIAIHEKNDEVAFELMINLFVRMIGWESEMYYKKVASWADLISDLRIMLDFWNDITDQSEKVKIILKDLCPYHLKGFILAHWTLITSETEQQIENAFKALAKEKIDILTSEAWFLIILTIIGYGTLAYKLSKESLYTNQLTPRLIRHWILYNKKEVLDQVPAEELPTDVISQFLLLPTIDEQMEFLRKLTNNGTDPLPTEMWKLPNLSSLDRIMQNNELVDLDSTEHLFTNYYFLSAKDKYQVMSYIKQFGFGQYTYLDIDESILKVLHYWDVNHPSEIACLMNTMWYDFIPGLAIIKSDIARNAVFDRYANIFAVRPEFFQKYTGWIKKELVTKSVKWNSNGNEFSFSLNETAPFYYYLQAANNIASISINKCDQLLIEAIKHYKSNSELMKAAASLYAAGKETPPVIPPCPISSKLILKDWQMGIVETKINQITYALVNESSET